jgi:hypothetical protein
VAADDDDDDRMRDLCFSPFGDDAMCCYNNLGNSSIREAQLGRSTDELYKLLQNAKTNCHSLVCIVFCM